MKKNDRSALPGYDAQRKQPWLNSLPSVMSKLVLLLPLVKWLLKPGPQSKYSHLNPTDLWHRR